MFSIYIPLSRTYYFLRVIHCCYNYNSSYKSNKMSASDMSKSTQDQAMLSQLIIPERQLPLKRLKSNDSSTSSTFSRNSSSSSVATTLSTHLSHSPTQFKHSPLSPSLTSLTEALHLSFSKAANLETSDATTAPPTSTPTNELNNLEKWCIILVGLPASGKSSITNNLINTLKTTYHIDTFNAGFIRRKLSNFENQDSKFFDFNNPQGKKQRDLFATISLEHLLNSLLMDNLDIGILDATNSTRDRRDSIFKTIKAKQQQSGITIHTLVLEIKCEDQKCWEYNARAKTKGPDYCKMGYNQALKDFMDRAHKYRDAFEEITQDEMSQDGGVFITFKDVGKEVEKFGVEEYLQKEEVKDDCEKDEVFEMIMKFIDCYYEVFGKNYLDMVYGDV